jgi:phosphoglycolate/pyridoxal phosphate phosphatase family enzyme
VSRPDQVFEGYAFDLDGTVYLGDDALPGAVEAINRLRESGKRVVFVTNKPLETAVEYAKKLTLLGIASSECDVVTAADSLVSYLHKFHPGAELLAISEQSLQDVLTQQGFSLTRDPAAAQVVVVSFDRTFDYAKLNAAYRAVKLHGAVIVATNPDPYCPTPDGGLPDCAAMLAAIEACTGTRAEAVLGKPSHYMVDTLLERLGVPAGDTAMVGDRLNTDMAMAEQTGMIGVLVLSGATTARDVEQSEVRPRYVIDDLRQLLPG